MFYTLLDLFRPENQWIGLGDFSEPAGTPSAAVERDGDAEAFERTLLRRSGICFNMEKHG